MCYVLHNTLGIRITFLVDTQASVLVTLHWRFDRGPTRLYYSLSRSGRCRNQWTFESVSPVNPTNQSLRAAVCPAVKKWVFLEFTVREPRYTALSCFMHVLPRYCYHRPRSIYRHALVTYAPYSSARTLLRRAQRESVFHTKSAVRPGESVTLRAYSPSACIPLVLNYHFFSVLSRKWRADRTASYNLLHGQ